MKDKKFDNINLILKSISPIKNTFSKMSKKLDKSFKYTSLNNVIKSLDAKYIYKDQFEPTPEIVLHKNDYDVNFQNSYDYLEELSDINNLPLVLQNKNYIKDGNFNPEYENDLGKKEISKKYLVEEEDKRKRERLRKRVELLRKFKASDSIIDPGKYHPNYDAIKRRNPCAYIRSPKLHIKNSWLINCPFRNTFEDFKRKENEKKENSKNKSVIKESNSQNQSNNINKNNNNSNNNINNNSNLTITNNINNNNKNEPKLNTNEYSPSSLSTNEINKDKNDAEPLLKADNVIIKKNMVKKLRNLALPVIQNNIRKNHISSGHIPKRKMTRSISYENYLLKQSPILFNKMKGRDSLFVDTKYLISYDPNYDSTFPHVPSTIFKYAKNKQEYKKYINGKIIRGYFYNPRDYYVMELQREEEKKLSSN